MNDSEALNRALTMAEDWKKRAEESDKQNQDLQAQIQKLSSDKQKLSEALKQRNKDLQNLNAQLVKLKGSRQGSTREQPTKAPERPIKPQYPGNKGRGREI